MNTAPRTWARDAAARRDDVLRIGYFGSYAKGRWGVGSDLDIVVIVEHSDLPFERRAAVDWDTTSLPVPADVLVYTQAEWNRADFNTRFRRELEHEAVWVLVQD